MKGLDDYLIPYLISQGVSIAILLAAWKNTRLARLLFSIMFLYAGFYNLTLGFRKPDEYLGFAELAIPIYRDFINGWFSRHNHIVIPVIASGQLAIGVSMVLQGIWVKLACLGAIAFLLSIAPLMVGSAFPFSLTVSAAAILIWRNDKKNFLWKTPPPSKQAF